MAAGKCDKCDHTWSRFQNGGHKCPVDNTVKIPPHIWEQVIKTANECKSAWVKKILKREVD